MSEKRETHYDYDIFLSYSHKDEDQVKQLASQLSAQKLKVWCAPHAILAGDQIPSTLAEGLQKSRVVVAILSPSSVKSWWANKEWSMRFMQISRESTSKLIPLLLQTCDIPPFFSDTKYVDFHDVDFNDPLTFESKTQELINQIQESLPGLDVTPVTLPVIIIAMNRKEAEQLVLGEIFKDRGEQKKQFDNLLKVLKSFWPKNFQYPESFVNQYREFREDWQPFLGENITIGQVIDGMIDWVNKHHPNMKKAFIQRQYYSDRFLLLNNDGLKIWEYLRNIGCLLVLDIVSIFHPDVRKAFNDSCIAANNNVSIVGVSPISLYSLNTTQKLEKILKEQLLVIFNRFDSYAPECAFEIGDVRSLNRWLYTILPETSRAIQLQKADPENIKKIQSLTEPKPHTVSSLIFLR